MNELQERLSTLSAAEEFFDFFGIGYEPNVVHVNRLHILKRFHDYLRRVPDLTQMDEAAAWTAYRDNLTRAYQDFVTSNAATEKVFKLYQQAAPGTAFVTLESLRKKL